MRDDVVETTETSGRDFGPEMRKLVTSISTRFIHLGSKEIDEGINEALAALGEFADVDRAYVFVTSDDRRFLSNTHEWCREGIESHIENLRVVPADTAPWMMECLARFDPVHLPSLSDMPSGAESERAFLDAQGIQSLLIVPLAYNDIFRGFLGFDSVRRERSWNEETIELLTIVGEVFINALERKRTEEILRSSEERYRTLFETHPSPLLVYDVGTRRILAVNETAVKQYGFDRSEFLELTVFDLHPPEEVPRLEQDLRSIDPSQTSVGIWKHRTRSGEIIEVEARAFPFSFNGRRTRLVIAENVTERTRTVQALRDSETRYRTLVEVSPDLIAVHSAGTFIFINAAGARMLGAGNPEKVVGRRVVEFVHPDFRNVVSEGFRELTSETSADSLLEIKLVRLDGRVIDVDVSGSQLAYEGKSAGLIVARETSDRKAAEREIRRTISLLQSTLESTTDGILVVDQKGRITAYNQRFLQLWGLPHALVETRDDNAALKVAANRLKDPENFLSKVQELYENLEAESFDILEFVDGRTIERYSAPQHLEGVPIGRVWSFRDVTDRMRAERAVLESERRYRHLFERNLAGVYRNTVDGRILDCNDACARIFGFSSRDQLMEHAANDLYYDVAERGELLDRLKEKGSLRGAEVCLKRRDGSPVWVLETVSLVEDDDGELRILEGTLIDISDRKSAEAALAESEERYRLMAQYSTDMISRHTTDGIYLYASPACHTLLGYESDAMLGTSIHDYIHPDDREEFGKAYERILGGAEIQVARYRVRRNDASWTWFETTSRAIRSPDTGSVMEIISVSRDITERKEAEQRIEYQAYHDSLTDLPNRMLFKDRLSMALARAQRLDKSLGVMFLDLDHFKFVNDTLGHTVGDRLLQGVATRLRDTLRKEDTVSRMGGDEFTILVVDLATDEDVVRIAGKLLEVIADPFVIDDHELHVTTSLGIALYPQDGTDADTLLRNADGAMYRAKELGRSNYQLCTPAMNARAAERVSIERSLRRATARKEFTIHYQPQVDLESGSIAGCEALLRWRHPERGLVYPQEFIGILEDARMIFPIGEWVLVRACGQTRQWIEEISPDLRVAVNISARQFQQRELVSVVEKALNESRLDPSRLQLEITETVAMQNTEWSLGMLEDLKSMGVSIAIDDFGMGHSALSYLKQFPIDVVKIDRSFIGGMPEVEGDAAIVTAMITMAHGLGIRVIAEGVERESQREFLLERGCDEIQGFLFSRPMPPDEASEFLRHSRA